MPESADTLFSVIYCLLAASDILALGGYGGLPTSSSVIFMSTWLRALS